MTDEILEMACALGHLEASELLGTLCQGAEAELNGMLREGVTADHCQAAFCLAAAWMALAALILAGDDGVSRFSAGDVTVEQTDRMGRAAALRMQAKQVMRPYLADDGFAFLGVRG